MIRPEEPGKNWTGNDRYMGYCVDLAKRIAEMVNFTYELRLVKDDNNREFRFKRLWYSNSNTI